jgi:hypothetical protein
MRRAIALTAFVLSLALVPASSARIPLPCEYWVHGCDAKAYICETGVCDDVSLPPLDATKR